MRRILSFTVMLLAVSVALSVAPAVAEDYMVVYLGTGKQNYAYGESILTTITLENAVADTLVAPEAFPERSFHLLLSLVDENGDEITATELVTTDLDHGVESPAPRVYPVDLDGDSDLELAQVEPVVKIDHPWMVEVGPFDLNTYYRMRPGIFTMRSKIHTRFVKKASVIEANAKLLGKIGSEHDLFAGKLKDQKELRICIEGDADGDGYVYPSCAPGVMADCDDDTASVNPGAAEILYDGIDNDCNPDTPDFPVAAGATINFEAIIHQVGSGAETSASRTPVEDLIIRLFDISPGSCAETYYTGASWQQYPDIWNYCPHYQGQIIQTDELGTATTRVAAGDYRALGRYNPDGSTTDNGDEIYIGRNVEDLGDAETRKVYIQVIQKVDGKKVPGKYTIRTGSELIIIEPEYVEWDGTQELYPFVLETVGDWTVTTSVQPPEGFVADHEALTTDVNTDLKALQFTITDVGSQWVDTQVVHEIVHKDKKEKIKSKIGIKCSDKIQKEKNFDKFCKEK